MKTTVDIASPLLDEAKRLAARDHTSLGALIEEGLRQVLRERRHPHEFRLRAASYPGNGLQAGIEEGNWDRIRSLAYQGREG